MSMSPIILNDSPATIIFLIVLIWMLFLALKDQKSLRKGNHVDYKSVIVSLGVLGTFIGIAFGLWEFDTLHIDKSVPKLLEGLKLAFLTSIAGMGISIFLSTIQKKEFSGGEEELSVFKQINEKLSGIKEINEQIKGLRLEIRDEQKSTRLLIEKNNQTLENLATDDSLKSFRIEVHEEQLKSRTFLEEQFSATNKTLEQAIEFLSRGATEEIIKALENVISDFNKNLVDQFGDNFKQLNEAVVNLLKWQEQYKEILEKDQGLLTEIRTSIEASKQTLEEISLRNDEVMKVYEQLKSVINTYDNQVATLNKQLETFSTMGTKATDVFNELSKGFEKVQSGMGEQSEAISKLTKDISQKLPDSLGQLENTLVGLTTQFGKDYKAFLDNYRNLLS